VASGNILPLRRRVTGISRHEGKELEDEEDLRDLSKEIYVRGLCGKKCHLTTREISKLKHAPRNL